MLITFEGIDASGKTTQLALAHSWLEQSGHPTLVLREPGGTALSESIRTILLDPQFTEMAEVTELLLFSAARAQLCDEVILQSLQKGFIVLCDRFADSTTAYQGYGRGIDLEAIRWINRLVVGRIRPDLTFILDIPYDVAMKRHADSGDRADRMEQATRPFFDRVRQGYHAIASAESDRCIILDGTRDLDALHHELIGIIESRMKEKSTPTGKAL